MVAVEGRLLVGRRVEGALFCRVLEIREIQEIREFKE